MKWIIATLILTLLLLMLSVMASASSINPTEVISRKGVIENTGKCGAVDLIVARYTYNNQDYRLFISLENMRTILISYAVDGTPISVIFGEIKNDPLTFIVREELTPTEAKNRYGNVCNYIGEAGVPAIYGGNKIWKTQEETKEIFR